MSRLHGRLEIAAPAAAAVDTTGPDPVAPEGTGVLIGERESIAGAVRLFEAARSRILIATDFGLHGANPYTHAWDAAYEDFVAAVAAAAARGIELRMIISAQDVGRIVHPPFATRITRHVAPAYPGSMRVRFQVVGDHEAFTLLDDAIALVGHPHVLGPEPPIALGVLRDSRLVQRLTGEFERRWAHAIEAPTFPAIRRLWSNTMDDRFAPRR